MDFSRPDKYIELDLSQSGHLIQYSYPYPDSKVHGAKMGPTWVLSAPDGPNVGPMNLAIRVLIHRFAQQSRLLGFMTILPMSSVFQNRWDRLTKQTFSWNVQWHLPYKSDTMSGDNIAVFPMWYFSKEWLIFIYWLEFKYDFFYATTHI